MSYKVKLDIFEGPLDLLLYLIRKNEVDIYDIPIATITEQYLEYLDLMTVLNLDIAGEYLVMAATLTKIKSKMLLPPVEDDESEEEADLQAELLEHLLEYQHYKEVAYQLKNRELLEKNIFTRLQADEQVTEDKRDGEVIEVSLFDLVDALRKVIEKKDLPGNLMEVNVERISVKDKIADIILTLKEKQEIIFQTIFDALSTKYEIIVTFLAVLELMRLRAIKVFQVHPHGEIRIIALKTDLSIQDLAY